MPNRNARENIELSSEKEMKLRSRIDQYDIEKSFAESNTHSLLVEYSGKCIPETQELYGYGQEALKIVFESNYIQYLPENFLDHKFELNAPDKPQIEAILEEIQSRARDSLDRIFSRLQITPYVKLLTEDEERKSGATFYAENSDWILQLEQLFVLMEKGEISSPFENLRLVLACAIFFEINYQCSICGGDRTCDPDSPDNYLYRIDSFLDLTAKLKAYDHMQSKIKSKIASRISHQEDYESKKEVIDHYKKNKHLYKSSREAAIKMAGKIVPYTWRTLYKWLLEHNKEST